MEIEFRLEAYHKFLLRESNKNRRVLARMIFADVVEDNNQLAYALLEMTGDKTYTIGTFIDAADLLLKADQR